jgi:4-coumarate--CoA ligase
MSTALVVRRAGHGYLNEHDITSVVAEKLPHYKQLFGGVYFVDELPTSPNGKIIRKIVKEIALTKYLNRHGK